VILCSSFYTMASGPPSSRHLSAKLHVVTYIIFLISKYENIFYIVKHTDKSICFIIKQYIKANKIRNSYKLMVREHRGGMLFRKISHL